jgi:type I restriction enzyme S subunit
VLSDFRGATVGGIGRTFLEKVTVPLPPLNKQQRIAAILDQADDLRRKRREVLERLVDLGDALLNHMLNQHQHAVEAHHFSQIADLDRHSFVNGPFGSDLLTAELQDEGVPVVYIRDIRDREYRRISQVCVSERKAQEIAFCSVVPGDVLIAKVGDPPGVAAIYPEGEPKGVVTQDVIRFRPNRRKVLPEYVAYFLNSSLGQHRVNSITVMATRARFSLGDLKKLTIDVIPLELQRAFAARIAEIDKLKCHHRLHLAKFDGLFASLQYRAFRGEL